MNPYRNKAAISLAALILLGVLIGLMQDRALDSGRPFLVQEVVRLVLTPVNVASQHVFAFGNWLVRAARPRGSLLRENADLRREVRRLTEENARLAEAAEENARLRMELGFVRNSPIEMVGAEVIGRQASSWFDTATINRGSRAGMVKGAAVVNFRGLVGQVVETDFLTSQIVALTDQSSAVGAMVRRSRCSGMIQGQGEEELILNYLPKDADVKVSDIVVSSGIGRVIPKGFVIGRVVRVVRSQTAGGTIALVRPSVRLDQLEEVMVVREGHASGGLLPRRVSPTRGAP